MSIGMLMSILVWAQEAVFTHINVLRAQVAILLMDMSY